MKENVEPSLVSESTDFPTVPLDDALAEREANASALVFVATVQSLEHLEDVVLLLWIDANPLVTVLGDDLQPRRLVAAVYDRVARRF